MGWRRVPGGARRARAVTYGMVGLLLVVAVAQREPWPLSSFRLFSERRTGDRTAWVLVAVDGTGHRYPLRLGPEPRVVRAAQRQLPHLAALPAGEQRAKVRALLAVAAPTTVYGAEGQVLFERRNARAVVVQRVERRLDPDGGPPTELSRTDIVWIDLR